ncbi:glycosyltransferase family 4 protein [Undibacterium terreum]|nr:glycosyltransferase [Undibacterium terreum]
MGQLSRELVAAGYQVSVMTLAFSARTSDMHNGVRIISVDMPDFALAIRNAVASGEFDTCILIQDPLGNIIWSVEGLSPPPRTKVFIQPIINEDGYGRWKDNADFRSRLTAILKAADAALVMTRSGPDTRYMQEDGIAHVYLPNAISQMAPAGDFRKQFGIPADRFVILHVANLYWVKNHVGLIDALPDLPASWQLVMIGNLTGAADCVSAVQAKLATRPDILFIPGLPPEWVSAAMEACDVAVLASHGEGSPITILEAMSHSKPWLATPQCGAANDHLGGLISDLKDFKGKLRVLTDYPAIRRELGQISYEHWKQCYSWDVALRGWTDLIEQGRLQREFVPEPALAGQMQELRTSITKALQEQQDIALPGTDGTSRKPGRPALTVLLDQRGSARDQQAGGLVAELSRDFTLQVSYLQDNPDGPVAGMDLLLDLSGHEQLPQAWLVPPNRVVRYLDTYLPGNAALANAASFISSTALIEARYAGLCDITHCELGVDFSIFNIENRNVDGPALFGWAGNVNLNRQDVFDVLIPAMREDIKVAIADPSLSPREAALFYKSVDVVLVLSATEQKLPAIQDAMACGVFPVCVNAAGVQELISDKRNGLLVERSPEALRAAMQWCAENITTVRQAGYVNANAIALAHSTRYASNAWKEVLWRTLRKAESAPRLQN